MPDWVVQGYRAYSERLPTHIRVELTEIPVGGRPGRGEDDLLLRHAEPADLVIALDEAGRHWSSAQLAEQMDGWLQRAPHVALLIGGPDGLSERCRERARSLWSLSKLTLPHGLVRVVLAEQLYRAWSILQGHPYHRA
jgi:23S rRNA (pseudouridine1915-N3)-methyltransferase